MKKDYEDLLKKATYDPKYKPEPEQIIIRIEGQNIGSLENFITITGMPKNGKGRYMAAIAAGAITRREIFGISTRVPEGKEKVCYIDTEQGSWDFYKAMDTIRHLADIPELPASFTALHTREFDPTDILGVIECYLKLTPDCSLLIIDGLLDLLHSYNDEGESKKVINILKAWTKNYKILAPCVLHRGKSTSTTVGHLGGMADRASQSILIVEKIKERGTYQLRPDFLRSATDFTPIEIYYDIHAQRWLETTYIPKEDTKVKKIKLKPFEMDISIHRQNVNRVFNADEVLQYNDLVQNIKEMYACGTDWARSCIPHLLKEQLIFKTNYGYTNNSKAKLFIK